MEKKRLQFDFTDEALEVLDRLQETTGLHTRAELIRHALRFLQWAVDETSTKNATLLVEKDGNVREVILPWAIGSQPRAAFTPPAPRPKPEPPAERKPQHDPYAPGRRAIRLEDE
jgi:hypothetical protein